MKLWAFMTGDYVTEESAAHGDVAERGWVDLRWSRHDFFDNRNDVSPVIDTDTRNEDLADEVKSALDEIGAYEDNGNGTFYGVDPEEDYKNGGHYMYAIHFVTKSFGPFGWQEKPWHPSEAGIDV